MTKKLQILECAVPNGEQVQVANTRGYIQINLSPAEVLSVILPVEYTLMKLVLCDVYQNYRPIHDGSRLDLSGFAALKTIKVPSNLLFQAPEAHPSRDGVFRLLPRSLEWMKVGLTSGLRALNPPLFFSTHSKQISFPENNGIKYANPPQETEHIPSNEIGPTDLSWLEELATYKHLCFPRLTSVKLHEWCPGRLQMTGHRMVRFPTPDSTLDLFDASGIKLRIKARCAWKFAPSGDQRGDFAITRGGVLGRKNPLL
jgi:hypothetical protein